MDQDTRKQSHILNTSDSSNDVEQHDDVFLKLEMAWNLYEYARNNYVKVQQDVEKFIRENDPYKVSRLRQWDNRCEFPDEH